MTTSMNGAAAWPLPNGPSLARTRVRAAEPEPHRPWLRGRWAVAQLATAALLLITFLGIYRVAWDDRSPGTGTGPNGAVVPATDASCGGTSAAAGSPVPVAVRMASPTSGASPDIAFVWASDGAPETPALLSHVAVDPRCRLWVMEPDTDRFLIFDLDGTLLETWGGPGTGDGQFDFGTGDFYFMSGIAFAPDGGFYVSDVMNKRVQQFDADRAFVRSWFLNGGEAAESELPSWIAVGPDGNVYVTVYAVDGIIQVFSPDGVFIRKFGSGDAGLGRLGRSGPIAFDPAGNIWVADPENRTLVQFSPAGEPLARLELPELGVLAMGLAIDAAGRFYVVDFDDNSVSVFGPDGTFLYAWGELGLGEGEFLNPFGIALDGNGGVYISEGGSPRVQKFHIQP